MEYAGGGELFHYIVKKKRLSDNDVNFFFFQIINGLEYMHKNNIVHRDMKPENLLLTDENSKILKIIDFGLSNEFSEGRRLSTPCGSPCYAAPEMVLGKRYSGFKTDVWSVGIILFAMACGYLPFEDKSNDVLFKKIIECKVEFPHYISFIHKDLIKKILVANPADRVTVEEIKKHSVYIQGRNCFYRENKIYTDIFLNKSTESVIQDYVINLIAKEYDFEFSKVEKCIKNKIYDASITTYYEIILKKLVNDRELISKILKEHIKEKEININITESNNNSFNHLDLPKDARININYFNNVQCLNINYNSVKTENTPRGEGSLSPKKITKKYFLKTEHINTLEPVHKRYESINTTRVNTPNLRTNINLLSKGDGNIENTTENKVSPSGIKKLNVTKLNLDFLKKNNEEEKEFTLSSPVRVSLNINTLSPYKKTSKANMKYSTLHQKKRSIVSVDLDSLTKENFNLNTNSNNDQTIFNKAKKTYNKIINKENNKINTERNKLVSAIKKLIAGNNTNTNKFVSQKNCVPTILTKAREGCVTARGKTPQPTPRPVSTVPEESKENFNPTGKISRRKKNSYAASIDFQPSGKKTNNKFHTIFKNYFLPNQNTTRDGLDTLERDDIVNELNNKSSTSPTKFKHSFSLTHRESSTVNKGIGNLKMNSVYSSINSVNPIQTTAGRLTSRSSKENVFDVSKDSTKYSLKKLKTFYSPVKKKIDLSLYYTNNNEVTKGKKKHSEQNLIFKNSKNPEVKEIKLNLYPPNGVNLVKKMSSVTQSFRVGKDKTNSSLKRKSTIN
jgi:serine/threonine protein kinase